MWWTGRGVHVEEEKVQQMATETAWFESSDTLYLTLFFACDATSRYVLSACRSACNLSNFPYLRVQVVDARMYQVVASLSHPSFRTSSSFSRACLSPSAAYAAAASANGNVYVWDVAASSSGGGSASSPPPSSSSAAVATVLQTHGVAATGCDWCLNMPSTLASCDFKGGLRIWG